MLDQFPRSTPGESRLVEGWVTLVGHDLWAELRKRPDVDDGTGPWSMREHVLRVVDAEVHPADPPLVEFGAWRMVRDVVVG